MHANLLRVRGHGWHSGACAGSSRENAGAEGKSSIPEG